MIFTSDSRDPVISLKNVHLSYPISIHQNRGLRDRFVSLLKSPLYTTSTDVLHALNNLNFDLSAGDRLALIGRNGAGKSTLCRVLSGIYRPQKGIVQVNGRIRSILDPSAIIYADLSGRENAEILFRLLDGKIDSPRLKEALDLTGLGPFLDVAYRAYSTGMKTRLILSIVACMDADVLILDEAFDGADFEFQKVITARMQNLIRKSKVSIFVSHSEQVVRDNCNRAILIEKGKILFNGDVESAYREYKSLSQLNI